MLAIPREPFTAIARVTEVVDAHIPPGVSLAPHAGIALDLAGYAHRGLYMSSDYSRRKKDRSHQEGSAALRTQNRCPQHHRRHRASPHSSNPGTACSRAGRQETDGTVMLHGDVGGHMCSFAQLTRYSGAPLHLLCRGHASHPAGTQLSPLPVCEKAHSFSDETLESG